MKRREFIRTLSAAAFLAIYESGKVGYSRSSTGTFWGKESSVIYQVATQVKQSAIAPPDKRILLDCKAIAVPLASQNEPLVLRWSKVPLPPLPARLRVTVASDDPEEKIVRVVLAQSQRAIGELDIRFAKELQIFELVLAEENTVAILEEGIALEVVKGTTPLWLLYKDTEPIDDRAALLPHLMFGIGSNRLGEFYFRLCSPNSLQPLGWMEGCILDGLFDLQEADIIPREIAEACLDERLRIFLPEDAYYRIEGTVIKTPDGRGMGVEGTLPLAVLAQKQPSHPAIDTAIALWMGMRDAEGSVTDRYYLVAECNYTVAYPMAVIARLRNDAELEELALTQLRNRQKYLVVGEDIYLRWIPSQGRHSFRNWLRGIAWYALGMARTLDLLADRPDIDDLKQELQRVANWVSLYQRESGLWSCFIDEPSVTVDTSGSAGIAAALAIAARRGLIGATAFETAEKALNGLAAYLKPDGFLSGTAQANRGGEALQRSNYRIISPMAMGLKAQLIAALSSSGRSQP